VHPEKERALEHRVTSAAEAALAHHHYVSAIDVLTGMGLLAPAHVQDWRKGRIDFLERVIHANLKKISLSMASSANGAGQGPEAQRDPLRAAG